MAVSPPPAPSSIDLSGLPPRVVEAAARVLALCREELRSEPRPEALSFLKTYSAARVGPRRTTRATVSVVGPGGKIATVASTDMHKLNVGAVFFFSTVSAQRKRAARF